MFKLLDHHYEIMLCHFILYGENAVFFMVKDSKFNSSEYVEIIVCYYYGFVPILKRDPEEQKRVIATFEATDKIKEIIELLREGRLSVEPQRFLLANKAVQKLIRNVPVF